MEETMKGVRNEARVAMSRADRFSIASFIRINSGSNLKGLSRAEAQRNAGMSN